jgi:hypothetical protein
MHLDFPSWVSFFNQHSLSRYPLSPIKFHHAIINKVVEGCRGDALLVT